VRFIKVGPFESDEGGSNEDQPTWRSQSELSLPALPERDAALLAIPFFRPVSFNGEKQAIRCGARVHFCVFTRARGEGLWFTFSR